jgi:plasmid maintenance system antidote protein VapI
MVNGIHIGEMIHNEILKQHITVVKFAKLLNCDRTNIYRIFKRKSIDVDLLERICIILKVNFFEQYNNDTIKKLKK